MDYIRLTENMINVRLWSDFHRHQEVTKCHRKVNGEWVIIDNPFTEDWGEKEYEFLVKCLKNTVRTGGVVLGAFDDKYLELSSIHVTEERRGSGIGRQLFERICAWAREMGAQKLYISAHSSVESQSFYRAVGCREAEEYSRYHAEKEPCDCQLEFVL